MKIGLPPPPSGYPDGDCRKQSAWVAEAGWRLRCQLAQHARRGETPPRGAVVVAITAPKALGCAFDAHAGPAIDLLCRHGVIVSADDIHGISVLWHAEETVDIALEPAAICAGQEEEGA